MTDLYSLYKAPFRYHQGYIWDADSNMVADDPAGNSVGSTLRVRGWGRLQYLPNAADVQDGLGSIIAQALDEHWVRQQPPKLDVFWVSLNREIAGLRERRLRANLIILPKTYVEEMTKTLIEDTPLSEKQEIYGIPVVLTEAPASHEAYLLYKNHEGVTCLIALL